MFVSLKNTLTYWDNLSWLVEGKENFKSGVSQDTYVVMIRIFSILHLLYYYCAHRFIFFSLAQFSQVCFINK